MNYLLFKSFFDEEYSQLKVKNKKLDLNSILKKAYTRLKITFKGSKKLPNWYRESFKHYRSLVKQNSPKGLDLRIKNLMERLYIDTFINLGKESAKELLIH